jgi:hypothetical protein
VELWVYYKTRYTTRGIQYDYSPAWVWWAFPRPRFVHEVLGHAAQATALGGALCAPQVLDFGAQPMPAASRRYLILVPRPLPAAPLVERRSYFIAVLRPMPVAPRRYLVVVHRP